MTQQSVLVLACSLALTFGLQGANEEQKKNLREALGQSLNIQKAGDSLEISPKGGAGEKQAFRTNVSRGPKKVGVALRHNGGRKNGTDIRLDYDEDTRTVLVSAAGRNLSVVIQPNNSVNVGGTMCAGTAADCIANAVMAALPGLEAEELAAMLLEVGDDLMERQNGVYISNAILQTTGELKRKARPQKSN